MYEPPVGSDPTLDSWKNFTHHICHLKQTVPEFRTEDRLLKSHSRQFITLYGLGTRIDPVSYMAFRPKASPSNMDGPMLLKMF